MRISANERKRCAIAFARFARHYRRYAVASEERMRNRTVRPLFFAFPLIPAAVIFLLAYLQVRKWLYPQSPPVEPQDAGSPFAVVKFETEDGLKISAWYAPPPRAEGNAVLLLHGHRGNRDQLLVHAQYLVAAGYGALLIDFRNHGDSDGDRTSMGYHEIKDARAAYRYLERHEDVKRIALWGHSMGGAVACMLMSEVDAAALFVDATFTDFSALVRDGVVARGLPASPISEILVWLYGVLSGSDWSALRPLDALANFDKSALLFHGSDDPVIPLAESKRFAAAKASIRLTVFEGGGHSDLYDLDPQRYQSEVLAYLRDSFAALSHE